MNAAALGSLAMDWVLWNSAGAAVVVVLVLAAEILLKNRISARWRYNLWLLVIVRLVVPTLPAVHFHVPQWAKLGREPIRVTALPAASTPVASARPAEIAVEPTFTVPADLQVVNLNSISCSPAAVPAAQTPVKNVAASVPIRIKQPEPAPVRARMNWRGALVCAWLAGMSLMLLRLAWTSIRLSLATRWLEPISDPAVLELLVACCRMMGVSRIPRVLSAPAGSGPALVGAWSPKLLLPCCVVAKFDRRELRSILLHELSHVKRRDVAVNYLIAILEAVHWFNPLVWLAVARMRAERELACDEAVLRLTPSGDRRSYGCTMLKLLEALCGGGVPAGALGVVQRKGLMHRRIAMIAQFDAGRRRWSGTGTVLSLFLIGAAAVSAVRAQQAPPAPAQPPFQSNPGGVGIDQARHAIETAGGNNALPPVGTMPPGVEVTPASPNPIAAPFAQPQAVMAALPPTATPQPAPGMPQGVPEIGVEQMPPGAILTVEDTAAFQANAKTEEKLKHPQDAKFEGVSFRDVLTNLADAGSIDIVIDEKAIADVGIDSSATPITMSVREPRPLEQVLQLTLRLASRDLDYSLVDGVVFVSTRAELGRHVVTRAYGVSTEGDRNELSNLILNTLGRNQGIHLAYLGDKLIVTAPEPSQRELGKLLVMLGDQISRPPHVGQQPQGRAAVNPSADQIVAVMNDLVPKMQQLANEAIATSNKFGPRSPELQNVAKQLDVLGQELALIGDEMSKQGRDADVARLKAAMDQIKATLGPLRAEPELTAPPAAR